jgi:hypothetical protein
VQELKHLAAAFERPSLFDLSLIVCLLALAGLALQLA